MKPTKASTRIHINTSMIGISIGVFFLLFSLNLETFLLHKIVPLQLILSIPFLLFSSLAYSKVGYHRYTDAFERYAWFGFATGYAFIINTIGILTGLFIDIWFGMIFFVVNWLLAISYTLVNVKHAKRSIKKQFIKDAYFIILQIVFGVYVLFGII